MNLKVNIIVWLEFELTYFKATYAKETPSSKFFQMKNKNDIN